MLQNILIAALTTLGIIKSSTDEEDVSKIKRIKSAKWWKTILYAVLCVFCLILILKTYTVATIEKRVEINYLSGSVRFDSILGKKIVADTASLFFYQRFEKHDDIDSIKGINDKLPYTGGFDISFKYHLKDDFSYTKDTIKENGKVYAIYPLWLKKYPEIQNIPKNFIDCAQFISRIDYINTEVPDIIPIASKVKLTEESTDPQIKDNYYRLQTWFNTKPLILDTLINNDYGLHSEIFPLTILHPNHPSNLEIPVTFSYPLDDFNEFGWLTAADISQVTMIYSFISDYPLDTIGIHFDIPVEIPEVYPKPDVKENFNLIFVNPFEKNIYNKDNRKQEIKFHAHIPQLANQQLIRSLLLTTLQTALIALFFSNLNNCFIRFLYKKRNKDNKRKIDNIIKVIKLEKKQIYRYNCVFAFIFFLFFAYSFYRVVINSPFQFSFLKNDILGINITSPFLCYCYIIILIVFIWICFNLILIKKYVKRQK